jgi:uncharacterized protein involved in response to NO
MQVFFSYAFRPFFLMSAIYAVIVVPYWTATWLGYLAMPTWLGTPSWWHAHEMIHGFAGGAIGGFALTAVANWTGRPPVSGIRLLILSGSWLVARVLFALPFSVLHPVAVIADLAFGVLLCALMSREVVSVRSRRNYKVLVILALIPVANAIFFLSVKRSPSVAAAALMAALWLVVLLVNVIAGRIVPAFTRNWLIRRGRPGDQERLPPSFDRFDLVTTCLMVGFAILQLSNRPAPWIGAWGILTSVLLLIRLFRWRGVAAAHEPLVWVLHLGFAWLPVGFLLLGLEQIGLVSRSAGIHAFTSGAITTMIVAVAGRAALGHTSRPLQSHPMLTAAYVLITIAAVCRVVAAFGPGARAWLVASAAAWCLGFGCFAWRYVPILTQPPPAKGHSLPTV